MITESKKAARSEVGSSPAGIAELELMEALGVAVYTTDAEGHITRYNEAAAELWGRHPDIGVDSWCGSWKLFWPDGTPMAHSECPMAIALKEGRPVRGVQAIAERPDGTRIPFAPFPSLLRDDAGNLIGAVNVLIDLSDRKAAEADAAQQRGLVAAIMQAMSTGLLLVNNAAEIEYINPAAELMTGYSFDELRGRPLHFAFCSSASGDQDSQSFLLAAVISGQPLQDHAESCTRKDGAAYHAVFTVAPITGGAIVELRDATEEKRAEAAIRESLAIKDQFLGLVSHELRTPISTIVGNAVLMLRRGSRLPEEGKQQALRDVLEEGEKLQTIIENLLTLTRLDARVVEEPQPVLIRPLVVETVESFQRRKPDRQISVTADETLPVIRFQPAGFSLVLENLLSNADKYSALGEPIEVLVSTVECGVAVTVRDRGIGFGETSVEEIFAPFFRSPEAKLQANGIGLGLAVCKRVVESQRGHIWADARPGGGAEFTFTIPGREGASSQ